ncbi:MAG: GTP cyclohydrolase I FolE [Alphaproteobacteria bacterium]|nr:GTP cyclohydrolase I FolE [Alphaproteobacteria bacterium]
MRPTRIEAEKAVETLLLWSGENPAREGLKDTPKRVVKSMQEFFAGYSMEASAVLTTVFEEVANYTDPILVRNISFYSHCEHHMVPIIGKAHISYLPNKKVVGLSKIARLVDIFAKRLQTQESLTAQIAEALMQHLQPKGVAILIEAEHMCMAMRGVKKTGSTTITTHFQGEYTSDPKLKQSFLDLLKL